MKCEHCNTEMKALLMSTYCPNDCDKPVIVENDMFDMEYFKRIYDTMADIQPMEEPLFSTRLDY